MRGRVVVLAVAGATAVAMASIAVPVGPVRAATAWTIVPSANAGGTGSNALTSISCPSTTNCIAVGTLTQTDGVTPIALQWDGSVWTQLVTQMPPRATSAFFTSVSCPSATFCMAVGRFIDP